MTQEQPLVGIGDIAKFLKVSKSTARRTLKQRHVPVFYIGKFISVTPSDLLGALKVSQGTSLTRSDSL